MVDGNVIIIIVVNIILNLCGCDVTGGFVQKPPTRRYIEIAYTTRRPKNEQCTLIMYTASPQRNANPYYNIKQYFL